MTAARPAAAALAAAAALSAAAPSAASAAGRAAEVCAAHTRLYDTPGGLVVGFLVDGDRVRVLRRTGDRRHTRVRSAQRVVGWVRSAHLCR